jgi:hypothetical protein
MVTPILAKIKLALRIKHEALDEDILHEAHCDKCALVRLLNLGV